MIWQGNEKEEDDDENGYLQKERESSHLLKGAELGAHFVRRVKSKERMRKTIGVLMDLAGRNTLDEFCNAGIVESSSAVVVSSEDVVDSSDDVVESVASVDGVEVSVSVVV
ncbi:hypothetical protein GCK72_001324 [Caenorhabditis remanei]|uniref:Uncharacterized protein n=1 Tax=Caenorhabditis remanei TaxID=31234 RepID=A0A6A5HT35_CAERE|nr:hypothetical protein GCK72_001324 [Caenorhabditis remanei]KAF1769507.1 hypothetical protein GCK72_001324 [Caenorhabditis remanei]